MTSVRNATPYAPLGFRSYFSLMQGLVSPEEICAYANQQGYQSVGMVDVNNFYGMVRFLKAAEQEGVTPLVGVTLRSSGRDWLTAYVLNRAGFARINGVLSQLLYTLSPYLKPPPEPYDPVNDLMLGGWDGLALVTAQTDVLTRLLQAGEHNLYYKIVYGCGFVEEVRQARRLGLPVLAVNEGVYRREEELGYYNMLRAIDLNLPVFKLPEGEKLKPFQQVVGYGEMYNFFSAVPEALKNGCELVEKSDCRTLLSQEFVFPSFNGLERKEAYRELRAQCLAGITRRYGQSSPPLEKRLNYELAIIEEKNFSSYFLVVRDIVATCPRTCGRGSSAASVVSYLLGITHVDPLKYNLFFERFLNRGRKDPPDIDVDFPWNERNKVLEYVFRKYNGRAGMVANHVTLAGRSSIRETAKALGMKDPEIDRYMRLHHLRRDDGIPDYVRQVARYIRGFPRYLGLHCGGVVITPQPITCYTHVQPSLAGYPVIAWEKDAAEGAGLVKIDLLGNRSLGVLRDTLNLVERGHGQKIPWESFNPLSDAGTCGLIESGNTLGIFYIESPATRQLLKKMRRGSYENIVIASSIIRPAANRFIRKFVERLHAGSYTPLHPLIARTLKETFGILVYQEDVSRVAIDLAGFSIEEADSLRKIIAKKDQGGRLEDFRGRFFAGGRERGAGEEVLTEIWEMILSFQGYSFCKAHSASYALVSYKLAYLKKYYPLEFMVAVINNGGGFYSRQTYVNEVQRMGYPVLPPDVNCSRYRYAIEERQLRVGLCQLVGISTPFLKNIIAECRLAPFADLADFISRLEPGLPEMRMLIRSGALDSIAGGLTRPQIFWFFFTFRKDESLFLLPPVPSFIGDYTDTVKVVDEFQTLGLIISRHPLKIFRQRLQKILHRTGIPRIINSRDIPAYRNQYVYLAGLIVTGKEVPTRTKERMIFVSFEDPYSIYEAVFFPESFKKFYHLLATMGVYLIYGKIEDDMGALNVNVQHLISLNRQEEE